MEGDLQVVQDWGPENLRVSAGDFVQQPPVISSIARLNVLPLLAALSCSDTPYDQ